MTDFSKTYALIAAYNEEEKIGAVIEGLVSQGIKTVVIDDGSLDRTKEVALEKGAEVFRQEQNQGKGAALVKGFQVLLEKKDFDHVIILDGDGQHDSQSCKSFLEAARSTGAGIVIGNRMKDPRGMSFDRLWTNRVTSFIVSKICGQKIEDCQCGYRLLRREVIEKITLTTSRYDIECDMIIQASRAGYKIASTTIESIYRKEVSHIHPARDTIKFIKLAAKALFTKR